MRCTFAFTLLLTMTTAAFAAPDGKALYQQHCFGCHGAKGLGDGPNAALLDSKPGNLAAANYKLGESDKTVFKVITDGVKGTPMDGFAKKLSEADRHALVDYLKVLRGEK